MPLYRSSGLTDVGRVRKHNEDSFLHDDALGLYVVADGLGGHAAGEVASEEAVHQVRAWIRRERGRIDGLITNPYDTDMQNAAEQVVRSAIMSASLKPVGARVDQLEQTQSISPMVASRANRWTKTT